MRVCARVLVLLLLLAKGAHVHVASMTRRETKGGFGGGWVIELRRASTLTPASRNCWASTGMHVNTFAAQQFLQAGVDGGDLPPSGCRPAGVQRPGPKGKEPEQPRQRRLRAATPRATATAVRGGRRQQRR